MNNVRWVLLLVLTLFFSEAAWPQSDAQRTTVSQGTPVTLWMDWTRGDPHYGKDFIELYRLCERNSCVCVAAFKVISSKKTAQEFADYVTSFEHGRVPVVYNVVFSEERRFLGAHLVRVGDWSSDRFDHNDGLLGTRVTIKSGSASRITMSVGIGSPADCFPAHRR